MKENQNDKTPLPEPSEETKQWLAIRKEAASKIDPETCELLWRYAYDVDPYGVIEEAALDAWMEANNCAFTVGREYYARSPGNDIWVSFHDLPRATRNALWEKRSNELPPSLILPIKKE